MRAAILLSCWLFAGCVTRGALAPEAPSPAAHALEPKVEQMLARPSPDDEWQALGPDALAALSALALDRSQPNERRVRAIQSLPRLSSPALFDRLKSLAANPALEVPLRSQAMLTLSSARGPVAVADLRGFLDDANRSVRAAAARAVACASGDDARSALEDRLAQEEDPSVREALQQNLTRMLP